MSRTSRIGLGAIVLLSLVTGPTIAQAQPMAEPGSELTVYLMTMGPGDLVWERFGHNAIWVRDELNATDVAYNYGMFSFEQDNFILRFIRGHLDYWMQGFDAERTAAAYIHDDRSVWAQELNLTPAQRAELRDFLEWNARPENRYYRYDYYRDNCSTRVRDAIDRVLGGRIRAQTDGVPSGTTYRFHTGRLTRSDPLIYAGLQLALGQPVDREISAWEEMFLPMRFSDRIREIRVPDGAGGEVPLVRDEFVIYTATREPEAEGPPAWLPVYLGVGLLGGGLLALSGAYARGRRAARVAFTTLGITWAVLAGLLGLVLVILWGLTEHTVVYRNENLLQFSPLILPLAALLPAAAGSLRVRRAAFWLASVLAALALLGLVLQILPPFTQVNGELIALALPIHLGLAFGLHRWLSSTPGIRLDARAGRPAAAPERGPTAAAR